MVTLYDLISLVADQNHGNNRLNNPQEIAKTLVWYCQHDFDHDSWKHQISWISAYLSYHFIL